MNTLFLIFIIYVLSILITVLIISFLQKRASQRILALQNYLDEPEDHERYLPQAREEQAARAVLSMLADYNGQFSKNEILEKGDLSQIHVHEDSCDGLVGRRGHVCGGTDQDNPGKEDRRHHPLPLQDHIEDPFESIRVGRCDLHFLSLQRNR